MRTKVRTLLLPLSLLLACSDTTGPDSIVGSYDYWAWVPQFIADAPLSTGTLHINAVNDLDLEGWWDVTGYSTHLTSVADGDGWFLSASGSEVRGWEVQFVATHNVSVVGNGLRCDEYRFVESLTDITTVGTCTLNKR